MARKADIFFEIPQFIGINIVCGRSVKNNVV